jgi:glycosyltransferase involved in cell wall biosynthesis
MRSLFVIPVYNQVRELPLLLAELEEAGTPRDSILFVNNGCTDGSEKLIHKSGYEHIDVERNRGVGYACIIGIDRALDRGYDVFGTMAGNGKMLPAETPRILNPLRHGRADYVTGSRFHPEGASPNLPAFRRAAIPWVNLYVRALTGATLTDATCGFRAFRLDLIRRARFNWRESWLYTYGFEYYLYAQVLLDQNIRWTEVPITMRYPDKGRPYSKIKPFVGWWEMLKPWVVARVDRLGFEASTEASARGDGS